MAFVQGVHAINDAAGTTISVNITATTGNTLAVQVTYQDSITGATCADGTNTYTQLDRPTGVGFSQQTLYAKNITGGALTVTATTPSAAFRRIQVLEYSGLDAVSPLDGHVGNSSATFGTGTDACTSTNANTTVNGDTIVGLFYDNSSATLPTNGTGFGAARDPFTNAAGDCLQAEEKIQTTAGSVAATFTTTAGTDEIFVSMIAFKPSTAASPPPSPSPPSRRMISYARASW